MDLQVCRHSVMVAASIRYPLHNLQVMCWLRFTNGNLTRFCRKGNDFHTKNEPTAPISTIQHLTINKQLIYCIKRWAQYGFDRCCNCFTYNMNFRVWASTHTLGDILPFQGLISRKIVVFFAFSSLDISGSRYISVHSQQPIWNQVIMLIYLLYHIPKYGHVYQVFIFISWGCGVSITWSFTWFGE